MPKKKLCDCTISEILAYAIDHTDDCDPSVITGYVDCLGNPCLMTDCGCFYQVEKVLVFSIQSLWCCKYGNGEKDLERFRKYIEDDAPRIHFKKNRKWYADADKIVDAYGLQPKDDKVVFFFEKKGIKI